MKKQTKHLLPENSPIARRANDTIRHQRPFGLDRRDLRTRSVFDQQLGNFSFSKGEGGTLTLGGTANGNGVLNILDQTGGTSVIGDKDGLVIQDGALTFKNTSNTTIIDPSGIVSLANFVTDQVTSSSTFTTTGTAYTDLTGSTLDNFVLQRDTTVLITAFTAGYNVGRAFDSDRNLQVRVLDSVDGELISFFNNGNWILTDIDFGGESYGLSVTGEQVGITAYLDMTAGTHSMKLQFRAVESGGGAGTATVTSYTLNYSIMGS